MPLMVTVALDLKPPLLITCPSSMQPERNAAAAGFEQCMARCRLRLDIENQPLKMRQIAGAKEACNASLPEAEPARSLERVCVD